MHYELHYLKYFIEYCLVMSWHDDVMVANWVGEEIARSLFVVELNHLLCATQVGLALAFNKHAFLSKVSPQSTAHLENGNRTRLHVATDAYTYTRLKMCVKFIIINHIKRNSAVCK